MFDGSWGWFAVVVIDLAFDIVPGAERPFRGLLLLPRMHGAQWRRDGAVNGLLFATYTSTCPG